MKVGDLVTSVNTLADEDFTATQIVSFVNDAIAQINIACSANFPDMDALSPEDYTYFPNKWQRAMFIPFAVGRIKTVDGSQFEYNDNYGAFQATLEVFKAKYQIPDDYKDTSDAKRYDDDFSSNPWSWGQTSTSDDPLSN
jgi:hypothetical protein